MEWRRGARLVLLVSLLVAGFFLAPVETDAHGGALVRAVLAVVVLGTLAAGMTQLLRVHARGQERRVEGLVLGIVLVVVVFAFGFYLLQRHHAGQVAGLHTRVDALYFVVSTLSTIGYGDIHAVGQVARVLVVVQVVFDLVFVAAAASLLTSRLRSAAERRASEGVWGEPSPR